MLETIEKGHFSTILCPILVLGHLEFVLSLVLGPEDIMCNTDFRRQNCTLHEVVICVGVDELDDLWSFPILVSVVISVDGNLAIWMLELSNVDSCSTGMLFQEFDQGWQVVSQVL